MANFLEDLALELELQRIQSALSRKAEANVHTAAGTALTTPGRTPPQLTGLALVSNVNTITAQWNPTTITDLLKYEVQVSSDADMVSPATFTTRDTTFTYQQGSPDTTYYLRVRAVNQGFLNGPWTGILNTATGTISTAHIEAGAVNEFLSEVSDSSWDVLDTNGESNTSDAVSVDGLDAAAWVLFTVQLDFSFSCTWGASSTTNNLTVDLVRTADGVSPSYPDDILGSLVFDFKSNLPAAGGGTVDNVLTAFFNADNPGAGDFDYYIRLTTNIAGSGATLSVAVDILDIRVQVVKR